MKKLLYIILFCFAAFIVRGQVNVPTPPLITYTPMTAGGYAYKYMRADSGLAVPFRNLTTGRGVARPGAIVADAADSLLKYFNGLTWVTIGTGAIATYVDSISKVGDNLFYWEGGVGTGVALNKVDSIRQSEGTDSIWYFIGGDSTFVYRNISASGSVTEVTSTNSSITVANGTTTPAITLDTTLHHTYAYLQTVFAALVHTHVAADIVSGILPIARGGTGLGGIGSVGQQMRVAASGTALEYYTPSIGTGTVTNVSANYPLSVTSPTTTPVITLDTSLWKSLGYNDLRYQAIGDYSDDSAFVRHRNVSDDTLRLYRSNGDSSDVIFEVDAITLTTTGTSGAATLVDGVLNIPQYSGGGGSGTVTTVTATDNTGQTWTITNPTTTPNLSLALTKSAVGLSNVDNTSDVNKPVSTAQQTALDGQDALSELDDVVITTPADNQLLSYDATLSKWKNITGVKYNFSGLANGDLLKYSSAGDEWINFVPTYEPGLGNPASDGYVLSSTTAGVRSWVAGGGAAWALTGNAGTTSANFIGTTDNVPFKIRMLNQPSGFIDSNLTTRGRTFFGYAAGRNSQSFAGLTNTAFGFKALTLADSSNNTAVGNMALPVQTTGHSNTAVGSNSGLALTTGGQNTLMGFNAGKTFTTATNNTYIGFNAGALTTLANSTNTLIGAYAAAAATTMSRAVVIGATAVNSGVATGMNTVAVGVEALYNLTSGAGNTAVGMDALFNTNSGGGNLALGQYSGMHNNTVANQIFLNTINRTNYSGDQTGSPFYAQQNATVTSQIVTLNGKVGINTIAPNSNLHTTSLATAYNAQTATYSALITDHTIECTANTFTVTLPTAVGITGRIYVITNSGSGVITLATTSSQTFINVTATPTTLTLNQFNTVMVQSNGANWLRTSSL